MPSIRTVAIVSVLLFAAMAVYTSSLDPSIPAIQLTFTERGFNTILNGWNPSQVEIFKRHFLIDYPFLVCYGWLGYLIATRTSLFARFSKPTSQLLAMCLPVAAVADALENAFHLLFVFGAGLFDPALYFAAGVIASAKWLLLLVFVASAVCAKARSVG